MKTGCTLLAVLLAVAALSAAVAAPAAAETPATIFLPLGASHCRDFLRLEPMRKYDNGTTSISSNEAEDYFTYRGIEEWVRGFVTATNIHGAKTGAGDMTNGRDLYELMPQLFDYCRTHQDDIFSDATSGFLSSLRSSAP